MIERYGGEQEVNKAVRTVEDLARELGLTYEHSLREVIVAIHDQVAEERR